MRADAPALAALRTSRLTFPVAVAVILTGAATLLIWDVFHYDWLRGYDAYANSLYSDVIRLHHRLPTTSETDVWHTPPLFFAVAALIDSHRGVQLMDALAALAVVVFAGLIARELFPRSRLIQLAALAFAALTPVLIRTAVMYHPEPLAAALAVSGLYVVVRGLARGRPGLWTGVAAGLLFGLATLTRTWALAFAGAACIALLLEAWLERERSAVVAASALAGILLALSLPWFVHQALHYDSPFAFNRPAPKESFFSRRPASFYTALNLDAAFSRPYAPNYAAAVRRRSPALLLVPLSVVLLGLEFLVFQISYPHADGDTIKATYLLNAVAPLAVCAAYALGLLRGAGRVVTAAVLLMLAYAAVLDITFLVLPK
jgi:4-amino-4-deoxy-L-arabinose transferase-like glycosyltransferase